MKLLTKSPLLLLLLTNNPIDATSFQSISLTNLNLTAIKLTFMSNPNFPIRNLNNMNPPYCTPGQAPPAPLGYTPGTVFTNPRCRPVLFLPSGRISQGTPTATFQPPPPPPLPSQYTTIGGVAY